MTVALPFENGHWPWLHQPQSDHSPAIWGEFAACVELGFDEV